LHIRMPEQRPGWGAQSSSYFIIQDAVRRALGNEGLTA
jgi:hypothetical protein